MRFEIIGKRLKFQGSKPCQPAVFSERKFKRGLPVAAPWRFETTWQRLKLKANR
jgi:hypothetical protein